MFRVTNYLKLTVENGIRIHKRQNPLRNGNPVDENGKNGLVQCVLHGLYLNTDIKENQQ